MPCVWSEEAELPQTYHILNPFTLNTLLGGYEVLDEVLHQKTGLMQHFEGSSASLYLTHALSASEWLLLFNKAIDLRMKLTLYSAPEVALPDGFPAPENRRTYTLKPVAHTSYYIHSPKELPLDAIKIDVTELSTSDLFPTIKGALDSDTLTFRFAEKEGFLPQALNSGKTVVLSGAWPKELQYAVSAVIAERIKGACCGQLIVVSDEGDAFPCIEATELSLAPLRSINEEIFVSYATRYDSVYQALTNAAFVFISGETGVGKTHFLQQQWQKKHRCFYGEEAMDEWIKAQADKPDYITLFIDEANITPRQWSEFTYFTHGHAHIFYKGQYHVLSEQHRVIFAGNPKSYGGERTLPQLFERAHPILKFTPIPFNEALNRLHLAPEVCACITDFLNRVDTLVGEKLLITPREVLMIGLLMKTVGEQYWFSSDAELTRSIGYALLAPHVHQSERVFWEPEKIMALLNASLMPNPQDFIVTETMQPALEALFWHLELRNARCKERVPAGGLGGLVLEGEPGIGKSELIIKSLLASGLQQANDFIYIPASLDYEEKQQSLLDAFHEGRIVIIDEINSSPRLERLLNALLEGLDLDNHKAKKQGFLLLGTQNPISFQGREPTPPPLKHRLQHLELKPYSAAECILILTQGYDIPEEVAQEITYEYEVRKQVQPKLCFRDVLEWAKLWARKNTPIRYYFPDFFTPLPVEAAKSKALSRTRSDESLEVDEPPLKRQKP